MTFSTSRRLMGGLALGLFLLAGGLSTHAERPNQSSSTSVNLIWPVTPEVSLSERQVLLRRCPAAVTPVTGRVAATKPDGRGVTRRPNEPTATAAAFLPIPL